MCKCNEYEEDINHVLWQCSLYNNQRKKMYRKLCAINCFPPYHIDQILHELKKNILKIINKFILDCKIILLKYKSQEKCQRNNKKKIKNNFSILIIISILI